MQSDIFESDVTFVFLSTCAPKVGLMVRRVSKWKNDEEQAAVFNALVKSGFNVEVSLRVRCS